MTSMILQAEDLKESLQTNGFVIRNIQEEDEERFLDAEIEISPDIVIQIDWSGRQPEYSLTVEPFRTKRKHSGFRHIGYFATIETLFKALNKLGARTKAQAA